jgi:predicted Fe-Mo cluster-binding NifX family protein
VLRGLPLLPNPALQTLIAFLPFSGVLMPPSSITKIALPLAGDQFSSHFGQATSFAVFEVDTARRQILGRHDFPLLGQHACGFASTLREKGVDVLIVGGIGRGAIANLQAAQIAVCAGDPSLGVEALVQAFLAGQADPAQSNCNHDHDHGHEHGEGHQGACHCQSHS